MKKVPKTKIVCTMGPAVREIPMIKKLLEAGMSVARINFAHENLDFHAQTIKNIRQASKETGIPVAILTDVKGPEIRTGLMENDKSAILETGNEITVSCDPVPCTSKRISVSYKDLYSVVSPGIHIKIADGLIDLEVLEVKGTDILCIIKNGGKISSRKNVNVLGIKINLPAITPKDLNDIKFSMDQKVDFIAASFIRKPENVREIRHILENANSRIEIIAKIEDQEGIENIDEIIRVSDGIMVARGDLGVQLPPEEIPVVQKRLIHKCYTAGKPVITATQMLDSMMSNPIPTRAEVADVSNAVFDGTDAIMLSGETSIGQFPVEAVRMMYRIALNTESSPEYYELMNAAFANLKRKNIAASVAGAGFLMAGDLKANSILTPTLWGNTPKMISRYHPEQGIIAVTPYPTVQRNLQLYWGVQPILAEKVGSSDIMLTNAIAAGEKAGLIKSFDKVVILAGIPMDSSIMLNTVQIHLHCKVLAKSKRSFGKRITGKIVKVKSLEEAKAKITGKGHEILLTEYIDLDYMEVIKKMDGYILEEFSSMNINEIYKYNPEIVVLAKTKNALSILEDGQVVTIDGNDGLIYEGKED